MAAISGCRAHAAGGRAVVAPRAPSKSCGDEEPHCGLVVGRPEHEVPELAGTDRVGAQNPGGAVTGALDPPGPVVRGRRDGRLREPRRDLGGDSKPGDRFLGAQRVVVALDRQVKTAHLTGDAVEVIRVVDTDTQLHQPAGGRGHHPQLAAAVPGSKPPVGLSRKAELGVVGDCVGHVRHADRG